MPEPLTCPTCGTASAPTDCGLVLEELDGYEKALTIAEVKVEVVATVTLACPRCGEDIAEATATGVVAMTPRGEGWPV